MSFRFIEQHRKRCPVRVLCYALDVSPAGYYAWRLRPQSDRHRINQALLTEIRFLHPTAADAMAARAFTPPCISRAAA
jgi:putative transposase